MRDEKGPRIDVEGMRGHRATIVVAEFGDHQGVGESIRRPSDKPNNEIGHLLAAGRAFQELGARMEADAWSLVYQADEEAKKDAMAKRRSNTVQSKMTQTERQEYLDELFSLPDKPAPSLAEYDKGPSAVAAAAKSDLWQRLRGR